jgi:MYXO-CTERM domain-containing protein
VPASSFATLPNYLDLFQPRGNADGALFVRKPTQELGAAVAYGSPFLPDTWYRIAMVVQLDAATSAPRYDAYLNGQLYAEIIWDNIVVDSNRNAQLKDFDLVPDGTWSVAALSETDPSLPANASAFFAFNDNNNEVGELYVANMLFRSDALSGAEIAALGGPAPGLITAVPEPSSWVMGMAGLGLGGAALRRLRRRTRA